MNRFYRFLPCRIQALFLFRVLLAALLSTLLSTSCSSRRAATFADGGRVEVGIASWYGPGFHGKKTASGERYDMYGRTAAHKTLPMHTRVRVTNLENGLSIVVKINDRGPFIEGRIIDLSYGVARSLGMVKKGTARVRVEVLH